MLGISNRQIRSKVISKLPELAKEIIFDYKSKNKNGVNMTPQITSFNKRLNTNKFESFLGKFIEVEDFDKKSVQAINGFFQDFKFLTK